jgi:hypothetical protein
MIGPISLGSSPSKSDDSGSKSKVRLRHAAGDRPVILTYLIVLGVRVSGVSESRRKRKTNSAAGGCCESETIDGGLSLSSVQQVAERSQSSIMLCVGVGS